MTDERIKEEFEKWETTDPTHKELEILRKDNYDLSRVTFHAGFRAAERLAKIEALEELRDKSEYKMNPEMYRFFTERIAELKEEGE